MVNRPVERATLVLLCLVFLVVFIWLFSVPALAQTPSQRALEGKKILILHSHEANAPVFLGTDQGLSDTLQSGGLSGLNRSFESLDLRRNSGPEYRKLLVEQMRMKYSHSKPDMIITMYPEAMEFVLKDCRDVFADAPIIALHLPQNFKVPETDSRIIGYSSTATVDITGTLEIALKLVPGARRVYVVSGTHEIDRRVEDQTRGISRKWEGQLEFVYLSHMTFEDILTTISKAPRSSLILSLSFSQDVVGKNYISREAVQRLSQVSTAPVFGILDNTLGYGITGGSLVSFERIGTKAGQLVLDILRGTKTPDNIPAVLDVPSVPMFDWRQFRHWNLNEDALPKGSIVVNREFTIWDFRYYVILGLALVLAEAALILVLITQRRRKIAAETALRKAVEKYRNIFESALEGIFETSPQGQSLTANPALASMLGYDSPADVTSSIGDTANQIWANPNERADYVRLLEKQNVVLGFECQFFRRDGTKFWVSLNTRRVSGPDGQTLFYSGFVEDINERKLAQAEASRTRMELLHVERMSSLGELVASLAHELNQPLAAILSSAQAALRFLQSTSPDLNLIRTILQNVVQDDKRAAGVIISLRSLVKKEEREKETLNIHEVLSDVLNLFRSEAIIRNVEIKTDFESSLPPIYGDRIQLQQVVLNLITNATEVAAEMPHGQRRVILRTQATDHGIQVAVRDFGPGIDPARLHDIWKPFFTTKKDGLGMGLSISVSIIRAHGGRLWAESNPDGGTTFAFEISAIGNEQPLERNL
jgi:PAS domain S-box-containing protein